MSNELKVIETREVLGKEFRIYGTIEEPLFLAKDVAEFIDYSKSNGKYKVSQMASTVDDDEKLVSTIKTPGDNQYRQQTLLTEDGLYEVLFQSRKPIAKAFKKEVKVILKQLRQTGVVIMNNATDEAIDFEKKFGIYRIRKTFTTTKDIKKDYDEFNDLLPNQKFNNETKIKLNNILRDTLENRLSENMINLKPSEMLFIRETISEVQDNITKLSNKKNGGQKAALTKKFNKANKQAEDAKKEAEEAKKLAQQQQQDLLELKEKYDPTKFWTTVNCHPFSVNSMYKDNHITDAYDRWINNFPKEKLHSKEEYEKIANVDFNKPIVIYLKYRNLPKFDTDNLSKSFIDYIFNRYFLIDDKIVKGKIEYTQEHCDKFEDGQVRFTLRNMTEEEIERLNNRK